MTVGSAKTWLSIGWLIAVAPLIFVLVLRQQSEFFGNDPKEVWGWFSQFVLPALTLVGGAWTVTASPNDGNPIGNAKIFWVTAALSVFYIALLYLVIANLVGSAEPLAKLKESSLFLGIFQGLVIGVLGKFFIESGR